MQLLSPITATIAPDPAATQAPSDPAISRNGATVQRVFWKALKRRATVPFIQQQACVNGGVAANRHVSD
ncbi:unnamed protein product [Sphagnum troendelagicum]|uniref:Uncharacterized protein n=1 Tax=Sphagnum troendelagicum TaxID=128251 RepID=A0ABP0T8H0_9BRYO